MWPTCSRCTARRMEPKAEASAIPVLCCECGKHIRGPKPEKIKGVEQRISHGYCDPCFQKVKEKLAKLKGSHVGLHP